jgi:mRNA-degrading endonuclease RelE of RelBE toxin-antitoxin system
MVINPFSGDIETIKGKPGYYRRRVGRYRIKFTVLLEKREILILEFGTKGDFSY